MSTSCAIGMELSDGSVRAVRWHWDGYVAGVCFDSKKIDPSGFLIVILGLNSKLLRRMP